MLNKLREKISRFMYGRYGQDDLNLVLSIVFIAFYILFLITKSRVCYALSMIFVAFYIFRTLSKNLEARRKENEVFNSILKLIKTKWNFRKTHVVFMCRKCRTIVRVPRHKGKVEVTCPKCGTKKTVRTGSKE